MQATSTLTAPRRSDALLVALTRAADHSLLWIAASGVLAVGGRRARRAAARGLIAVAITSAVTNSVLKPAFRHPRPGHREPLVPRPRSSAFPSGHAASAFAFATAVSYQVPVLAPVLLPVAGAVAYSRVHTGVHHTRDVIVGSAVGAAIGAAVTTARHPGHLRRVPGGPPLLGEAVLVTSPRISGTRDFRAAQAEIRRLGLAVIARLDVSQVTRLPELLAAHDGPLLVVAAGGDGTAGSVADVLAGTSHVLGILPLGTSNNFARSLGIPVEPRAAAGMFARGKVATVDLGRFTPDGGQPRHFVHAAAVGLNADFARIATRGDLRNRLGRYAYLVAAAYAMRSRPAFTCVLRYPDASETVRLRQLSVINAPAFGGPLRLTVPASDPDDRQLDILTVPDIPPGRLLASAAGTLLCGTQPVPGIAVRHAAGVQVSAGQPMQVTVDGELAGALPGSFEVAGEALRVITPAGFTDIDDDTTGENLAERRAEVPRRKDLGPISR